MRRYFALKLSYFWVDISDIVSTSIGKWQQLKLLRISHLRSLKFLSLSMILHRYRYANFNKCTWYQYYIDIISSLWNTTLIEALLRINIVPSWLCLTLVSISTISYQYRFTCMTRQIQIIMNNIEVSIVILCTMSSINIDIIIGLNSLVCFVQFKMIKVSHCSQQ